MAGHGHSRGQQIDATGTLERGAHGPVLVLDGGGRWRLETSWRARKWIGKRVRVVGRRVEFDLLEVDSISAADGVSERGGRSAYHRRRTPVASIWLHL